MATEKTDQMQEQTALAVVDEAQIKHELALLEAKSNAAFALTKAGQALKQFEINQRVGQMYAKSTIVPATYQNNVANCAIAYDMAIRMNANPLMVMQNLYMVHGNPGWSSKFLIATINTCGRFTPLRYECNGKEGDEYGWRCFSYEISDREKKDRLEGTWVTWAMVKAEGWLNKNGSKWKTMPEVMFKYRAAAFWQRMYAPEISMGFNTVEELRDIEDVPYVDLAAVPKVPKIPAMDAFDEDNENPIPDNVNPETGEVIEDPQNLFGGEVR
ncbi:MAG: hypothetical protein K2N48_01485 [Muribaculaceae bacterium]|nr:hypothetical protein [Muribaculaceae bacterium]